MRCLDTTYFIDLIRAPDRVRDITTEIDKESRPCTTAFNVYEALYGAFVLKDKVKKRKMLDKLEKAMARVTVLPIDHRDAVKAAAIGGELKIDGREVGADALTAACALNNGCESLVTRNGKHFKWISDSTGLRVDVY